MIGILQQIWPTEAEFARDLELPYQTVHAWGRRGIPEKRFPAIIAAARKLGHSLTYEQLHGDDEVQDTHERDAPTQAAAE